MNHFGKTLILINAVILSVLPVSCGVFLGPDPDNSPRGIYDRIWNDFDETYALMDERKINWNAAYDKHVPPSGADERELFDACSALLKELDDPHVYLMSPFAFFNSGGRLDISGMEDFSLDVIKSGYLIGGGDSAGEGMFWYGTFASQPDVGYIYISGFAEGNVGIAQSQDWARAINGIIDTLSETKAIVLDIRGNRGGLPSNVDYIAGRFAAEKKDYVEVRTKNGPGRNDFSSPITHAITPAGTRYTKPIVLITNGQTISGGEWFTLALLTQDHVTHTGSATNGAFSLSLERPLINGWIYSVSVQKVTDMEGTCYEGTGIHPNAEHTITANVTETPPPATDAQLDHALGMTDSM
jgi:hypothetical protein